MNESEERRKKQLKKLNDYIENNVHDEPMKTALKEVATVLELHEEGIDSAHERIDTRRSELNSLSISLAKITTIVQAMAEDSKRTNADTRRHSKKTLYINLFAVGISFALLFGGAEAFKQLSFIVSSIKALNMIL